MDVVVMMMMMMMKWYNFDSSVVDSFQRRKRRGIRGCTCRSVSDRGTASGWDWRWWSWKCRWRTSCKSSSWCRARKLRWVLICALARRTQLCEDRVINNNARKMLLQKEWIKKKWSKFLPKHNWLHYWSAQNLGFIFDSHMSFTSLINTVYISCHPHIQNIRWIQSISLPLTLGVGGVWNADNVM